MNTKMAIPQWIETQAQQYPTHIAAMDGATVLSYQELNERANQLARHLELIGLKPNTPVALGLARSFELLISMVAILKAGGAFLPVDTNQPIERILFMLTNSQTPIVITNNTFARLFSDYEGQLILLENEKETIDQHPKNNLNTVISLDQLAYVIYTSGSTGMPKGVLIEHGNLVNYCQWSADYANLGVQQRIDFSVNYAFDLAVSLSIVPLMLGLTVVICDDATHKNLSAYLDFLNDFKINIIKSTPSFFKILLMEITAQPRALPHLQSITLGGESLNVSDCKTWLSYFPKQIIYNEYGPTETTIAVTQFKMDHNNIHTLGQHVPIGIAGHKMDCYILDETLEPLPDGKIGELYIGGACVGRGYLNQPELTKKHFIQNPFVTDRSARLYKSGDLCRKHPDGLIEFISRIDEQIKIRGFRIEPKEIEIQLTSHPEIIDARVITHADSMNENRLTAYYILKNKHTVLQFQQIINFLQDRLPPYMIPNVFISTSNFPLTINGKLDKSALPVPDFNFKRKYKAPSSSLGKELAKLWTAELSVGLVGVEDNFFELGGHSLSAARIVSQIQHNLGKKISLAEFYRTPTIQMLTAKLEAMTKTRPLDETALLNDTKPLPLSDFQLMLWLTLVFEPKAKKINIVARKRIQGLINEATLQTAILQVLKTQNVLNYQILKSRPVQNLQKNLDLKIDSKNLSSISEQDCEDALEKSKNELSQFQNWVKGSPLLLVRLFYLANNRSELQICMPHLIADDESLHILFNQISGIYNELTKQSPILPTPKTIDYQNYILREQRYSQSNLEEDIRFWDDYLKDAHLFVFPNQHIVKTSRFKPFTYSTYVDISEQTLQHFKAVCAKNKIGVGEGLGAALVMALSDLNPREVTQGPYVYINVVKSTRNDPLFDETIGCFLSLEPVKVALKAPHGLLDLAKKIHQTMIETSPHQRCPSLVKLASTQTLRHNKKPITGFLIKLLSSLYFKLFDIAPNLRTIFRMSTERLMSFERSNHFLINLNIHSDFIATKDKAKPRFLGFKESPIEDNVRDLLSIDSVLDVCFIRGTSPKQYQVVISANLQPDFRKLIAQKLIQNLISIN